MPAPPPMLARVPDPEESPPPAAAAPEAAAAPHEGGHGGAPEVPFASGLELGNAVASGAYHPPADASFTAIAPDGTVGTIKGIGIAAAHAAGFRIETPQQTELREAKEKYGGIGGQAAAAGLGALSGATAGLSNVALTQSGLVSGHTLEGLEEANPYTSTAAEIGGNIAPLLLSGGTSAAARAVSAIGTPVRAFGAISEHVGELAAKQLIKAGIKADSANLLARAAARGLPQAIGSGAEGALYGAAEAVNEHALGEPGTLSEKLIANMGMATLFGAPVGLVAGLATGSLAKSVLHEMHPGAKAGAAGREARATMHEAGGTEGMGHEATQAVDSQLDPQVAQAAKDGLGETAAAAADVSSVPEPTPDNLDVTGTPASRGAPIDPNSPEALRQVAAEAEAALHQGKPAEAFRAAFEGHGPLDQGLAAANISVKAASGPVQRMIERVSGIKLVKGLAEKWLETSSAMTSTKREALEQFIKGPGAKEARAIATSADAGLDDATRELTAHLNTMNKSRDIIEDSITGERKAAEAAKKIPPGSETKAVQNVMGMLSSVKSQLEHMVGEGIYTDYAVKHALKNVEARQARVLKLVQEREALSRVAADYGSGAGKQADDFASQLFIEADDAKRQFGGPTYRGLAMGRDSRDFPTKNALAQIYERTFRPALEDTAVWGDAGIMQKEINHGWNQKLTTQREVDATVMTRYGGNADGVGSQWVADPNKIGTVLRSMGDPKNDVVMQRLRENFDANLLLGEMSAKHATWTPAEKAAHLEQIEATKKAQELLLRIENTVIKKNQLAALERGGIAFNQGGAGLAGFFLGGPVGALIGMGAGSVATPGKVVRQLAMLDRIASKTDEAVGASIDGWLAASHGLGGQAEAGASGSTHGASHVRARAKEGAQEAVHGASHVAHEHHGHGFLHKAEEAGRRVIDHGVEIAAAQGTKVEHAERREAREVRRSLPRGGHGAHDGHAPSSGRAHHTTVKELTEAEGSAPPQRWVGKVTGPAQILVHAVGGGRFDPEPAEEDKVKTMDERIRHFQNMGQKLQDAVNDMDGTLHRVHLNTQVLGEVAPETAAGVAMTSAAAVKFLDSKIPKPDGPPMPASLREPMLPSEEDMDRFDRYAKAVDDPLSVLHDMGKGQMTSEGVETLKTLYPQLYGTMVDKTMERLETHGQPIPYSKKAQLSLLLGVPLDQTMTPDFLQFIGGGAVPPGALPAAPPPAPGGAPPPGAPPSPGGKVNVGGLKNAERSSRLQSRNQQLEGNP